MSQHDSESESESDGSITPSSTTSDDYPPENYVEGRDCHHLGHLEAIPIKREGTLVQIHHAWIWDRITEWTVLNTNKFGPRFDYCYKLPGLGNNWIAKTTEGTGGSTELFETVQRHSTKGYKYHVYECVHHGDNTLSSWIIESYLEVEKKEKVPEGRQMIWTLKERLGFDVWDLRLRRCRDRPSQYSEFGELWGAYQTRHEYDEEDEDEYEYDDEDERLDRGEFLDEDSDEEYDKEDDEGEGEDEDEE
jgi:hypothetical protein